MPDQTNQPIAGPQAVGNTPGDIPPGHPTPASLTPERAAAAMQRPEYRKGQLTHAGMQTVHARGESVMYQGRVIPPGQPLPSESDLAFGDEAAEQAVRDGIELQRKALDEQEKKLIAAQGQRRKAMEDAEKSEKARAQSAQTSNLDDMTVAELHQRASDLNIEGRSELKTRDELLKAIRAAERRAAK